MAHQADADVNPSGAVQAIATATRMADRAGHARAFFVRTPMEFVQIVSFFINYIIYFK